VHSDSANLVTGNGKALLTISKGEEGVQGMKYITDEQQEATFLFTATLVESLHGQGFTYKQTRTAVLAALKALFGSVCMVEADSGLGEELRECSRGAFQAAVARFYRDE
jgi:hypothetical protein